MAVQGGLVADRLAWVFVAGYQAALRRTFPAEVLHGWGAFAVSEDRRGDPPLPGVDYQQTKDEFVISGHKTWVAAVSCVEHLIIKAGRGARALLQFTSANAGFRFFGALGEFPSRDESGQRALECGDGSR